jgi:hypothetical protein
MTSHAPTPDLSAFQARLDKGVRLAAIGPRAVARFVANSFVGRYIKSEREEWMLDYPYRQRGLQVAFNAVFLAGLGMAGVATYGAIDRAGLPEYPGTLRVDGHAILPAHQESERISKNHYIDVDVPEQYFVDGAIDGADGNRVRVQVTKAEFDTAKTLDVTFDKTRLGHRLEARRTAGEVHVSVTRVTNTP